MEKIECGDESLILKEIKPEDVTEAYVTRLNDPETNQYLESRLIKHTTQSEKEFVKCMHDSPNNILFGIYIQDTHVGNIKIGNIHKEYKRADIGLLIGKSYWGKGIASEAIRQVTSISFEKLGLHKLFAGIYAENKYSLQAFLKNGWCLIGEQKDHVVLNGKYASCYLVEIINPNE